MKETLQYILLVLSITFFYGCEQNNQSAPMMKEKDHALNISSGTVKRYFFHSDFAECRNIDIWLPENYSAKQKYAVLYMHDGQMLYDSKSVWNGKEWGVDETLAILSGSGQIKDVIVVGIWNTGHKRHSEYFPEKAIEYIEEPMRTTLVSLMPGGPKADNYLKFLTEELKPFIDANFSTYKDQANTFICGSSMGGLISLYALCKYPDIFKGAACISTHWIGTFDHNKEIPEGINKYLKDYLPSSENHKIYFDYGTVGLDANYPEFQKMVDETMKEKNYTSNNWMTLEFEGDDHNEKYWAARLDKPFSFLLNKSELK